MMDRAFDLAELALVVGGFITCTRILAQAVVLTAGKKMGVHDD